MRQWTKVQRPPVCPFFAEQLQNDQSSQLSHAQALDSIPLGASRPPVRRRSSTAEADSQFALRSSTAEVHCQLASSHEQLRDSRRVSIAAGFPPRRPSRLSFLGSEGGDATSASLHPQPPQLPEAPHPPPCVKPLNLANLQEHLKMTPTR